MGKLLPALERKFSVPPSLPRIGGLRQFGCLRVQLAKFRHGHGGRAGNLGPRIPPGFACLAGFLRIAPDGHARTAAHGALPGGALGVRASLGRSSSEARYRMWRGGGSECELGS